MFFEDRAEVYRRLVDAGVYCGMHYKMNNRYGPYLECPKMPLDGAVEYERTELTLPMHVGLRYNDLDKIAETVCG